MLRGEALANGPGRRPRGWARRPRPTRRAPGWLLAALAVLAGSLLVGLGIGPAQIAPGPILESALSHLPFLHVHSSLSRPEDAILWQLRAPRVVLAGLVGGMLASAGSAYQGVFRNPLAVVHVLKEVEGFVFNRLQGALLREAYCLVRDGVVGVEDVDRVVRDGLGRRWAVVGPFETADLNTRGGIETHAALLGPAYQRRPSAGSTTPGRPTLWH